MRASARLTKFFNFLFESLPGQKKFNCFNCRRSEKGKRSFNQKDGKRYSSKKMRQKIHVDS